MKKTTLAEPPPRGWALGSSAWRNGRKLTGTAGNAALLCVLSMSSVQFGAALSAPTMNTFGSFSTTWIRLSWAAIVLALIVRPKIHTYSRSHWFAAGSLGVAMAGMTLCFFLAIQRIPLGLAVAIDFLGP